MRKSVMLALEALAPELFSAVRSTVFRSWDKPTIVSDFVLRWALAHGVASVRPYRHRYVSTGEADQDAQLRALVAEFGALEFFCINDTTDDAQTNDPRLQNVLAVLELILPGPSAFENAAALLTGVEHAEDFSAEIRGSEAMAAKGMSPALRSKLA